MIDVQNDLESSGRLNCDHRVLFKVGKNEACLRMILIKMI